MYLIKLWQDIPRRRRAPILQNVTFRVRGPKELPILVWGVAVFRRLGSSSAVWGLSECI